MDLFRVKSLTRITASWSSKAVMRMVINRHLDGEGYTLQDEEDESAHVASYEE